MQYLWVFQTNGSSYNVIELIVSFLRNVEHSCVFQIYSESCFFFSSNAENEMLRLVVSQVLFPLPQFLKAETA